MSRSSASAVLDRPESDARAVAVEADTTEAVAAPARAPRRTPSEVTARRGVAARLLSGRRLPHPPGRRAPIWFAALVAGAVLAGLPSLISSPSPVTISASDYGLGGDAELGTSGGMDDAGVRSGITAAEAQARLGELAASRAARAPKTVLPTQGRLSTCFCMRWGQMHWGIDLAAPLGTPILAATDGVVLRAGPATGFGNAVYIQNADGDVEIYGHMRYYNVHEGQIVHAGDQIAKVGSEGQSTGPHLHFELRHGSMEGRPFDPIPWLAKRGIKV